MDNMNYRIDPERIYLVIGQRGSYETHEEWPVGAYLTEALADEHARKAQDYALREGEAWKADSRRAFKTSPYDPEGKPFAEYVVEECRLLHVVPSEERPLLSPAPSAANR